MIGIGRSRRVADRRDDIHIVLRDLACTRTLKAHTEADSGNDGGVNIHEACAR